MDRSRDKEEVFNVRKYGAIEDGRAKETAAIQRAIDACQTAGGGTVYFPSGNYLSGSLHLKSNVTLHLDSGATILGSKDQADYDPYEKLDYNPDTDEEEAYFHYSLIWGENVHHVAVVDTGTIDGNRDQRGGPKPIALKKSQQITIRDITIKNSPNYTISLLGCDYVNIDGVTILNGYSDGIDLDCCHNVRISNCHIESWDDAIVPKSSFALGYKRTCENITVTNCLLSTSCNAFKLGTCSYGGFKNIAFSNSVIFNPSEGKQHPISGISLETVDGGFVNGIVVSNISMQNVSTPIFLRLGNRGGWKGGIKNPVPGTLRNVSIVNVVATGASLACSITGLPGHLVDGVTLDNIRILYKGGGKKDPAQEAVPEHPAKYPEANMFGELPAYGFYCRHARNLKLRNVQVQCETTDERPALICEDVENLQLDGFDAQSVAGEGPMIRLNQVRGAFIHSCRVPSGTGTFLWLEGNTTEKIKLINDDTISSLEAEV